jgi:Domain of unknown function (DUF1918)
VFADRNGSARVRRGATMHARIGDEIIVDGQHVDGLAKKGEVLAVLQTGGVEHYRVRWDDDGHEGLFYPGSDAHSIHPGRGGRTS